MGAFCVFGVSRQVCRKVAEKNIPTFYYEKVEGFPKPVRREWTAVEWGRLVSAEAERLFAESEKQVRISPELDAPQFCKDWLAASPGEVKITKLMYRGPKIDKHGAVVMKLGAPVLTWLEYDDSKAWPRPFGEVHA